MEFGRTVGLRDGHRNHDVIRGAADETGSGAEIWLERVDGEARIGSRVADRQLTTVSAHVNPNSLERGELKKLVSSVPKDSPGLMDGVKAHLASLVRYQPPTPEKGLAPL